MKFHGPSSPPPFALVALTFLFALLGAALAQSIGPNLNVSRMPADKTEPGIAIDPTHPERLFIASNIQDGNGLFAAFSTDAGASWSYTDPSDGVIADGTDSLPESCCDASVSVAADRFGNVFLIYLKTAGPSGIVVTVSTNGGQSFRHVVTLATQNAVDQPTVVTGCANANCGSGAVWITYKNASLPNAPVVVQGAPVTGLDEIGAFGGAQMVPGSASGNFGDIAVGPNGQVLVTFQTTAPPSGPGSIYVSLDPDGLGPAGFGNSTLATQTGVGAFDSIPAQPERGIDAEAGLAFDTFPGSSRLGRAYLIYTDKSGTPGDTDILVRYSDNLGGSWSAPTRVNNDVTGRSQFFPRIAVDATSGNVAASWYDCRSDSGDASAGDRTAGPNNDAEIYAAVSRDGGSNWLPNMKISTGVSAASLSENPNDFGEYMGLAFHAGNFYPVWSDNSNSTGDNPAGATSAEIYTARVRVGSGRVTIRGAGAEIVSEGCAPGNGVLDPNEPVMVSFALENVGGGLTENLIATLQPSGGVLNPSGPQAYGVLAAGDSPQAHFYSFLASGNCGGQITATLALSDGGATYGSVSFTFPLGTMATNAQGFSNAAPITIEDEAVSSPYPSVLHIANVTGTVTKVTVTLHRLIHTFPADLDMILVGPGGQSIMLMSDAGGGGNIDGTITFDDDAPALPGTSPIQPGTYAPRNYGGFSADFLPPPAPEIQSATSLSAFNGINPNGDWQLFIVDASPGDAGAIAGGWSVNLSSPRASCCVGGPLLSIASSPAGVVVSWPVSATGYALETATGLSATAIWGPLTAPVVVSNGLYNVRIPAADPARFFRLKK